MVNQLSATVHAVASTVGIEEGMNCFCYFEGCYMVCKKKEIFKPKQLASTKKTAEMARWERKNTGECGRGCFLGKLLELDIVKTESKKK